MILFISLISTEEMLTLNLSTLIYQHFITFPEAADSEIWLFYHYCRACYLLLSQLSAQFLKMTLLFFSSQRKAWEIALKDLSARRLNHWNIHVACLHFSSLPVPNPRAALGLNLWSRAADSWIKLAAVNLENCGQRGETEEVGELQIKSSKVKWLSLNVSYESYRMWLMTLHKVTLGVLFYNFLLFTADGSLQDIICFVAVPQTRATVITSVNSFL